MSIRDICHANFGTIAPEASLVEAAAKMRRENLDQLTVATDSGIIGVLSDRHIVVRAVARSLAPEKTPVESVMTVGIPYCMDDDDIDQAIRLMRTKRLRQIAVVDRDHHVVGIVRAEDVARSITDAKKRTDFLLAFGA